MVQRRGGRRRTRVNKAMGAFGHTNVPDTMRMRPKKRWMGKVQVVLIAMDALGHANVPENSGDLIPEGLDNNFDIESAV